MKSGRKIYLAVAGAADQERAIAALKNGALRSLLHYLLHGALYQSEPCGTVAGLATVAAMRRWLAKPAKKKGALLW